MINMASKKVIVPPDLIIHPGETIGDILIERNISQAELAVRTGVSPAYVCNVIAGKKDISARFAVALEYALGISKTFWINLQANYDVEMAEASAMQSITEEERNARESLAEIVDCLREEGKIPIDESVDASILTVRRLFQISNIANLKRLVPEGVRHTTGASIENPYVMGARLRLRQISEEGALQDEHSVS